MAVLKITANSIDQFSELQKKYNDLPEYIQETVTHIRCEFNTIFTHMIRKQHRFATSIPIKCMPATIKIKGSTILIIDHNHYEHHYHFDCESIPENLEIEIKNAV